MEKTTGIILAEETRSFAIGMQIKANTAFWPLFYCHPGLDPGSRAFKA
jgi:hypothetical protein